MSNAAMPKLFNEGSDNCLNLCPVRSPWVHPGLDSQAPTGEMPCPAPQSGDAQLGRGIGKLAKLAVVNCEAHAAQPEAATGA